jgi:hypothetical protein
MARCYEESLKGKSTRRIAEEERLSPSTVSGYIRKEAERRRAERPDYRQRSIDVHTRTIARAEEELAKDPSSHAVAQLLHAKTAAQSNIDLICGNRAPSKSVSYRADLVEQLEPDNLSAAELEALLMLLEKSLGNVEGDVLAEIVERYQDGTLVSYEYVEDEEDGDGEVLELPSATAEAS